MVECGAFWVEIWPYGTCSHKYENWDENCKRSEMCVKLIFSPILSLIFEKWVMKDALAVLFDNMSSYCLKLAHFQMHCMHSKDLG